MVDMLMGWWVPDYGMASKSDRESCSGNEPLRIYSDCVVISILLAKLHKNAILATAMSR